MFVLKKKPNIRFHVNWWDLCVGNADVGRCAGFPVWLQEVFMFVESIVCGRAHARSRVLGSTASMGSFYVHRPRRFQRCAAKFVRAKNTPNGNVWVFPRGAYEAARLVCVCA